MKNTKAILRWKGEYFIKVSKGECSNRGKEKLSDSASGGYMRIPDWLKAEAKYLLPLEFTEN